MHIFQNVLSARKPPGIFINEVCLLLFLKINWGCNKGLEGFQYQPVTSDLGAAEGIVYNESRNLRVSNSSTSPVLVPRSRNRWAHAGAMNVDVILNHTQTPWALGIVGVFLIWGDFRGAWQIFLRCTSLGFPHWLLILKTIFFLKNAWWLRRACKKKSRVTRGGVWSSGFFFGQSLWAKSPLSLCAPVLLAENLFGSHVQSKSRLYIIRVKLRNDVMRVRSQNGGLIGSTKALVFI